MDKTEKLILCVRQHRCLYDIGDVGYKNFAKKCLIWEHIANELDDTTEGVKGKWKHIRDGYTKYKKLRTCPPVSTTGKKEKYQNWVWGPQLRFLDDCVQPRPRIKNLLPKKRKAMENKPEEPQQNYPETSPSTSYQEQIMAPALLEAELLNPDHMSLNSELQSTDSSQLDQDLSHVQKDTDPFQDIDNSNLEKTSTSVENEKENSNEIVEMITINIDKETIDLQNDSSQMKDTCKPVRRRKINDAITHLFTSYAQTFKNLNPQIQAALKINLAQLFYEAEIREIGCPSEIQS